LHRLAPFGAQPFFFELSSSELRRSSAIACGVRRDDAARVVSARQIGSWPRIRLDRATAETLPKQTVDV